MVEAENDYALYKGCWSLKVNPHKEHPMSKRTAKKILNGGGIFLEVLVTGIKKQKRAFGILLKTNLAVLMNCHQK